MFDPHLIRNDFPILSTKLSSGKPLVYLDSAATSQKPQAVIDAIVVYYTHDNANVHRGIHELGDRATHAWHDARAVVAQFFGATPQELIAVRNTTESLNMVAYTWGEAHIHDGDVIIATQMDHHSNLVPWQELARRKKATLELVPVLLDGTLDLFWLETACKKYGTNLKMLCLPYVSNTLGTINQVKGIAAMLHRYNPEAVVVVDAAQAAPHLPIDFHALGIEFMAVSAHKMFGPMGMGGLFVRSEVLKDLPPYLFGGGMIGEVKDTSATFSEDIEDRFTAGTPDVAGMVGWAAACTYLQTLGIGNVAAHDAALVTYAIEQLSLIPEVTVVGPTTNRSGSVAFVYKGVHAHDVAQILDSEGIAVRSGHHCTMPLHEHMGWAATTRLSFNVYSTTDDIDALVIALAKVKTTFRIQ